MQDGWKSRKLWFHIVGFAAGFGLAYFGKLTPTVAGFIVTMSIGYSAGNVMDKKYIVEKAKAGVESLTGKSDDGKKGESEK